MYTQFTKHAHILLTIGLAAMFVGFVVMAFSLLPTPAEAKIRMNWNYKGSNITFEVRNDPRHIAGMKAYAKRHYDSGRRGRFNNAMASCNNVHKFNIGGSSLRGGSRGGGSRGGGGYSPPSPPPQCTHYRAGSWGACRDFDELTGQNGTQRRSVSSYTSGCPGGSRPSSTRSCDMPFEFSLLQGDIQNFDPNNSTAEGAGQLDDDDFDNIRGQGSEHDITVTFVGGSTSARQSSKTVIALNPRFPEHPDITAASFEVIDHHDAIPDDAEFVFEPETLAKDATAFKNGTAFSVIIPRIEAGEYPINIKINAGGFSAEALVRLHVRVVDPGFENI